MLKFDSIKENLIQYKNKLAIFRTIRFKLTLIYSIITFTFVASLVGVLNLYLNNYLKSEPRHMNPPRVWIKEIYPIPGNPDDFYVKLEERQLKTIREIRMQDLREIQRTSIISIFPLALLSFIIGYFLSGRFLKPIENLQLSISKLGKADLGKTIQVKNDDEVGKLIESFNGMSKRLKQAFDAQDNFVQDAQHELKTPLTIIHTNLDTALDDKTASNQELREAISNSLGAIKQMRALTNNLLDLTLPSEESQSTINLGNLVEGQINMLRTYADSMKVNLVFSHPEKELSIIANELAIQRAVFNIIENAIKYSANEENGKVKVQVISEQDKAIIKIIDNGPGIPLEQQQKIFERFYRLDKSRNKKSGGFGLGLAIAKKFIEDNSGEILLQSEPGNTEFNLSFRAVREKKQKHIGK